MIILLDTTTYILTEIETLSSPGVINLSSFYTTVSITLVNDVFLVSSFQNINDASSMFKIDSQCSMNMADGISYLPDPPTISLIVNKGVTLRSIVPQIFSSLPVLPASGIGCSLTNTNITYTIVNGPIDSLSKIEVSPSSNEQYSKPVEVVLDL